MHTQDLPNTQTGSAIAFRALAVKERRLDEELIAKRLERAAALRGRLFEGLDTNGAPGGGGNAWCDKAGSLRSGCVLCCGPRLLYAT